MSAPALFPKSRLAVTTELAGAVLQLRVDALCPAGRTVRLRIVSAKAAVTLIDRPVDGPWSSFAFTAGEDLPFDRDLRVELTAGGRPLAEPPSHTIRLSSGAAAAAPTGGGVR